VIAKCSAALLLAMPHAATAQTNAAETTAPTDILPLDLTITETKHEISASADYFLGFGEVSIPLYFSFDQSLNQTGNTPLASFQVGKRTSNFAGATLSYSFGQAWYVDFNYSSGSHSGTIGTVLSEDSPFRIDENYYQTYFRYAFPKFRGTRLSLYSRAGIGYNEAQIAVDADVAGNTFQNRNDSQDFIGNFGAGIGYSTITSASGGFKLTLQSELEGFYGRRSQEIEEKFGIDPNDQGPIVNIGNDIFGGIGRATVRFQFRLNESGLARAYVDLGVQGRYNGVQYEGLGTATEFLWGPYARAGFRYSF
jgi:hypothetical protein